MDFLILFLINFNQICRSPLVNQLYCSCLVMKKVLGFDASSGLALGDETRLHCFKRTLAYSKSSDFFFSVSMAFLQYYRPNHVHMCLAIVLRTPPIFPQTPSALRHFGRLNFYLFRWTDDGGCFARKPSYEQLLICLLVDLVSSILSFVSCTSAMKDRRLDFP